MGKFIRKQRNVLYFPKLFTFILNTLSKYQRPSNSLPFGRQNSSLELKLYLNIIPAHCVSKGSQASEDILSTSLSKLEIPVNKTESSTVREKARR